MISASLQRVAEGLRREVENTLTNLGFLCRVFGRGKSATSIERKISDNPGKYSEKGKLIQDSVGLRVVVYFPDDIEIIDKILRNHYSCDVNATSIDRPKKDEFSVTRHNLVFKTPEEWSHDLKYVQRSAPIDSTFEVQLRTILSEGWHEVEHDLRYKRKSDWTSHDDLSRYLNGVVATLETSEWSMKKIFEDLAYRHYKSRNWDAMLHSVFRMRAIANLSSELEALFKSDYKIGKEALRINRGQLFQNLNSLAPKIPLTIDNLVYLWNHYSLKNSDIERITPGILLENFSANLSRAARD